MVVVVVVDSAPLARQSQVSVTINSSGSVAVPASQKGKAAANNVPRDGQRKSLRLRWLWPQFNVFDRQKKELAQECPLQIPSIFLLPIDVRPAGRVIRRHYDVGG